MIWLKGLSSRCALGIYKCASFSKLRNNRRVTGKHSLLLSPKILGYHGENFCSFSRPRPAVMIRVPCSYCLAAWEALRLSCHPWHKKQVWQHQSCRRNCCAWLQQLRCECEKGGCYLEGCYYDLDCSADPILFFVCMRVCILLFWL